MANTTIEQSFYYFNSGCELILCCAKENPLAFRWWKRKFPVFIFSLAFGELICETHSTRSTNRWIYVYISLFTYAHKAEFIAFFARVSLCNFHALWMVQCACHFYMRTAKQKRFTLSRWQMMWEKLPKTDTFTLFFFISISSTFLFYAHANG